jgi:hypothetical protein
MLHRIQKLESGGADPLVFNIGDGNAAHYANYAHTTQFAEGVTP